MHEFEFCRFMKIGWAGDSFPEATYPTLLGRPMLRYEEKIENIELKVYYLPNLIQYLCRV